MFAIVLLGLTSCMKKEEITQIPGDNKGFEVHVYYKNSTGIVILNDIERKFGSLEREGVVVFEASELRSLIFLRQLGKETGVTVYNGNVRTHFGDVEFIKL